MAEINDLTVINENFEDIKGLLNSIRAQGVLNTSDVDKLLVGINEKLEKLNSEEDIDLIKVYLSDLKNNFEERHGVLISKFGAIESLFSNLLKNSSETMKSSELKELFDIIATNLSVFSREVVSQKEALTDISLRLDAMRSDDTHKKEIIKNISLLKNDLDRLTNGFDSVVLSLNENFKTIVKTISGLDQTDLAEKFGSKIDEITDSFNTVLSAVQVLDQKHNQIENNINRLATQEDVNSTKKIVNDLSIKNQEVANAVELISEKLYKMDNLSEKIDASVNIIVGLKSVVSESTDSSAQTILTRLNGLEETLVAISDNDKFEKFTYSLKDVLNQVLDSTLGLKIQDLISGFNKVESDLKENNDVNTEKLYQFAEVNITRTLNEITASAEALSSTINNNASSLTEICEKSFTDVLDKVAAVKDTVAQLDENNTSANNAIFSNITDRLAFFENTLKESLDRQEYSVDNSSRNLLEQVSVLKEMSGNLDYKLDASIIEANSAKTELSSLKDSVNGILAMDFINVIKELRTDLYAVKQDLNEKVESSQEESVRKNADDLFSKYELLISKLDSFEDELKGVQNNALKDLKQNLDSISSSLVDVLSYVSDIKSSDSTSFDEKLNGFSEFLKDNNLNYVESVRDVVDVIRVQVDNNISKISRDNIERFNQLSSSITKSEESIKEEIKHSYNKLLEVQDNFNEIKESINVNHITQNTNYENILSSADGLKSDFEYKLTTLKNSLLDQINEYKKEFTCDNADKISELKFLSESFHSKNHQNAIDLKNDLQTAISSNIDNLISEVKLLSEQVAGTTLKLEGSNKEIVSFVRNDFASDLDNMVQGLKGNVDDLSCNISEKAEGITKGFDSLSKSVEELSENNRSTLSTVLAQILDNFVALKSVVNNLGEKNENDLKINANVLVEKIADLKERLNQIDSDIDEDLSRQITIIEDNFTVLSNTISDLLKEGENSLDEKLTRGIAGISKQIEESVVEQMELSKLKVEEIFDRVIDKNNSTSAFFREKIVELNSILHTTLEEQNNIASNRLSEIASTLKDVINENIRLSGADYESLKAKFDLFSSHLEDINNSLVENVKTQLDDIAKFVDVGIQTQAQEINVKFDEISEKISNSSNVVRELNVKTQEDVDKITADLADFKVYVNASLSDSATIFVNKVEEISKDVNSQNNEILSSVIKINDDSKNEINTSIVTGLSDMTSAVDTKLSELKTITEELSSSHKGLIAEKAQTIFRELSSVNDNLQTQLNTVKSTLNTNISTEINGLCEKIQSMVEQSSINFSSQLGNEASRFNEDINAKSLEIKASFDLLNERLDKDEISRMNVFQSQLKELNGTFNNLMEESKSVTKSEVATISQTLIQTSKDLMGEVENSIEEKINSLLAVNADISAGELQTFEAFVNRILEQVENNKQNIITCKNVISDLVKNELKNISGNIEKEADGIVKDITEQINISNDFRKDEFTAFASQIERSVAGYISDNVEDLKSFLDIKTDATVLNSKLDNLKTDLISTSEDVLFNINKLLEASVFDSSISDLKVANEILISSMSDKLNEQISNFIKSNVVEHIDEKIMLFDKKFTDTIVDKYEEVKIISSAYNNSFEKIEASVSGMISKFEDSHKKVSDTVTSLFEDINGSIDGLLVGFADLKAQILNKSFDEAFQASMNNQITGIEKLINEQLGYLQDIGELCENNLPEITEMNAIVKLNIQKSISELAEKLESQQTSVENGLNELKTDIVTQFINIFNQISFVAEQEEILDFIQEKHSELITILSHIVTTVDTVEDVKDNIVVVDNKIDNLKEDIDLINEKITSIISSDGDINYVYSLQDLESDIANLRIVLNEMKDNNNSKELQDLVNSTNNIYSLVESVKNEMPHLNINEFKQDFEALNEDIVSISTRTNKLILASDESYKTLQDNLQDFKLVINDLDERTRNFAHEVGMDRIDNKLGALNEMISKGAKTNQVFNQIFEYLAEWVDNASVQIASISDKVETLDDIGQIKVMLQDLKADAEDDTSSNELVEALTNVFDKQAKRISSLEAKLDKMIVENTIYNKTNKLDLSPFENTLNRFLAAIGDKVASQQNTINSLEGKLEEVVSIIDTKDTAALTKKVGGMDRQIAKLNKSIEKIASHVVEK